MGQIVCPYEHTEASQYWDWDFPCDGRRTDVHFVDTQAWLIWLTEEVASLRARLAFEHNTPSSTDPTSGP